jgi:hypothetical protein
MLHGLFDWFYVNLEGCTGLDLKPTKAHLESYSSEAWGLRDRAPVAIFAAGEVRR